MDSLVSSKPNLYNRPEWQCAVQTALSSGIIENETKADIYRLALRTSNWPSLFRRLDYMQQTDDCEPSFNALIVAKTATEEMDLIQQLSEISFASMRNQGNITEQPDHASPFLTCYRFTQPLMAMLFILYAMARIAIGYAVKHVLALNGTHRPDIAREISEMSLKIGRCIKYARQFKPLFGCRGFILALVLSFESCSERERQSVTDALNDLEHYRNPSSKPWCKQGIMSLAKHMTGRTIITSNLRIKPKDQTGKVK